MSMRGGGQFVWEYSYFLVWLFCEQGNQLRKITWWKLRVGRSLCGGHAQTFGVLGWTGRGHKIPAYMCRREESANFTEYVPCKVSDIYSFVRTIWGAALRQILRSHSCRFFENGLVKVPFWEILKFALLLHAGFFLFWPLAQHLVSTQQAAIPAGVDWLCVFERNALVHGLKNVAGFLLRDEKLGASSSEGIDFPPAPQLRNLCWAAITVPMYLTQTSICLPSGDKKGCAKSQLLANESHFKPSNTVGDWTHSVVWSVQEQDLFFPLALPPNFLSPFQGLSGRDG